MSRNAKGLRRTSARKKVSLVGEATDFEKGSPRQVLCAFLLGTLVVGAPVVLGRSYLFFGGFILFSLIVSILWRKAYRPWMLLASMTAATPMAIGKQQVTCNLLFAGWFAIFHVQSLSKLPKWLYVPSALVLLGLLTSAINWMPGVMRQGTFAYNLFFGPFLLLPVLYFKIRESDDHAKKLGLLLYGLILPSSLLLFCSRFFGTITNDWEASQHIGSLAEGFLNYRFGKVVVSFLRTDVGFILAGLICASTAIVISPVQPRYRCVAGFCLVSNAYLLLLTGSFGSGASCFCGLAALFYKLFRKIGIFKVLLMAGLIAGGLVATYAATPEHIKAYLEKRYEHRVTEADTDRVVLWARAVEQIIQHPEGVGFTLSVGEKNAASFIHNEYLVYTVSYGLLGGLGYVFLVGGLLFFFLFARGQIDADPHAFAVYLAGLGVLVAVSLNCITDHLNANRWYFNVLWSIVWFSYFGSFDNAQTEKPLKKAGVIRSRKSRSRISLALGS